VGVVHAVDSHKMDFSNVIDGTGLVELDRFSAVVESARESFEDLRSFRDTEL
jgi:hypothetical protein